MDDLNFIETAERAAQASPCSRRQYGAVIVEQTADGVTAITSIGYNKRYGRCCDGDICVRDRIFAPHGQRVEVGAEIHAEAMTLLDWKRRSENARFFLAGFDKYGPITGGRMRPCHTCALMLKHSRFGYITIRNGFDLELLSVDRVIEEHELEWSEPVPNG